MTKGRLDALPGQTLTGRIASISIGRPESIPVEKGRPLKSSFLRKPKSTKIFLGYEGFENDQVADARLHGGADKAVCVYSQNHYKFWIEQKGLRLTIPAFGENLTIAGLVETEVHVGDIFQMGEAQVQISQPRQPCHKINKVYNKQEMACWVKTSGFTGYYFRVIQQGWVSPSDEIILQEQGAGAFTVDELNGFLSKSRNDYSFERLQLAAELNTLSDDWAGLLRKRVARLIPPTR